MNKIVRPTLFIAAWVMLSGCATPPAVIEHNEPLTAKERMDEAFSACTDAPHKYFTLCDTQSAADKIRMAALDEVNSSPIVAKEISNKYLKTVADEDKAFADMKTALDEWAGAIARLKTAAEDYKNSAGLKAESAVTAAMRTVESQESEYQKNVAKYEQGLKGWEKQRQLKPSVSQ
jgi:hypothetical protein